MDILSALPKPALFKYKILSYIFEIFYDLFLLISRKNDYKNTGTLTYGSTPIHTANNILSKVVTNKTKSFLDLGCGRGSFVFTAALGYNLEATGIELIDSHIKFIKLLLTIFRKAKINIIKNDFIKEPIPKSDIIFVSNTCFSPFMEILLTQKLESMPKGTIVISLSSPLISEKIEIFDENKYLFSWGKGTVYFGMIK
jgi:phospholipid N-methyltransferase